VRNLRCIISYDGSQYAGFQSQPKKNTIQNKLEQAIYQLTKENIKVISSGRTDSGVHARGQVINFHTSSTIPLEKWCIALNVNLPDDIVVLYTEEVPMKFNSRKLAKLKTYEYKIRVSKVPDVFQSRFELFHPTPLNVDAIEKALSFIEGEHDFTSFCSMRTEKLHKVRTIHKAWIELIPEINNYGYRNILVKIYFKGNGFLYHMIRIIVGTLIQIGEGKREITDMKSILEAKERKFAGPTADAHALSLWSVEYDNGISFS
jgi:tRNA pseudouridine38-40 synthase